MYKQFLKILQKSDDIYLFFLCENMSFNLGMNSTDTDTLYTIQGLIEAVIFNFF